MENVVLKVTNLKKQFGDFTAVNDVSFTLHRGEILGFLGINGAGKTTTMQMLLGVLTPTSGDIEYFGKSFLKDKEKILEQINFSSTYTNLPWRLTVKECLRFIAYLYDIDNREKRIMKVIEMFKIKTLANKSVAELSAGQRTVVNLAKSFINYPKILILDEPTASLDPEIAKYIRDLLLQQREEFNTTILITSHNMAEVEEVCNRVVFIDKGTIIANDTPDALAKTIEISHIDLLLKNHVQEAVEYCKEKNLPFKKTGKRIIVDVKEKEIAEFLHNLADKNIMYEEISIEKPTLEDYFLEKAFRKEAYEIS